MLGHSLGPSTANMEQLTLSHGIHHLHTLGGRTSTLLLCDLFHGPEESYLLHR